MAFVGKNNISSTALLTSQRAKYKIDAYSENNGQGRPLVKDIDFAEMVYYGKILRNGAAIYPKEEELLPIPQDAAIGATSQFFALPIISEMYREVKTNMQMNITFQKLSATSQQMTKLEVTQAWNNPKQEWSGYFERILTRFNQEFIPLRAGIGSVLNFDDYMKYFMIYISQEYKKSPITFSGWLKSGENSIFNTGLAFSIYNKGFDADMPKASFINNNQFNYYQTLLMNKGFSIVHNCPWVLVADLGSPAIYKYYNDADKQHINSFLMNNFSLARNIELQIIKIQLINYYNFFVVKNPTSKFLKVRCNKSSYAKYVSRAPLSTYNNKYVDSSKWIDIYATLRNIEAGYPIDKNDMKSLIKRAKKQQVGLDNLKTIRYIDLKFNDFVFKKPYGWVDLHRRTISANKMAVDKKLSKSLNEPTAATSGGSYAGSSGGGGMTGGY